MEDEQANSHIARAYDAAAVVGGVICRISAALVHGYDVAVIPELPQITVPRYRRRERFDRGVAYVRRMDLPPDDIVEDVTTPARTVVDCLRWLPPQEGIAFGDGLLRNGIEPSWIGALAQAPAAQVRSNSELWSTSSTDGLPTSSNQRCVPFA